MGWNRGVTFSCVYWVPSSVTKNWPCMCRLVFHFKCSSFKFCHRKHFRITNMKFSVIQISFLTGTDLRFVYLFEAVTEWVQFDFIIRRCQPVEKRVGNNVYAWGSGSIGADCNQLKQGNTGKWKQRLGLNFSPNEMSVWIQCKYNNDQTGSS